ncbi:H(+)/Cl(-) exchange transporter ClcA [Maledivibacter halophilus]|uniref:H+/Cl-antiporter ClcA n=1 Tax=Maledivibacter halophilus TaxID=36842 RepID=A0A1T5KPY6_9FIRM|nr:H(+)/Cl(-) exchange transporter ClcA [Maledivibacter halophilus]SKC65792.1 H+/Cl-antiporter ClcA [Maledivibacter halophilus]
MKKNSIIGTITHWRDFKLQVFSEGIIVGILTGIIAVLYRILLYHADIGRKKIYSLLKEKSFFYIVGWFLLLIVVGIILGKIVKKYPMIKGSGIPQVKGVLVRKLKMEWLKELITKFLGGVLALGFGLSLGREGPSVQLGSQVGMGVSSLFKRHNIEEKYLITSGASAGLAAAFNAPLAGVMFSLEELHKNISPIVLTCVMGASLVADFISSVALGLKPIFNFEVVSVFPLNKYAYLVILGILAGVVGKFFNTGLLKVQDYYSRQNLFKEEYKPIIPLVISGFLGFFLPQALGGGHNLIVHLSKVNMAIGVIILLLVVKFLFTIVCYGSGVPGGIFLPLLAIGALLGEGFGYICVNYFDIDSIYTINIIILSMAAFFTAVVRAPITGSILITEMTGTFDHLLGLITVSITAYIVTDLLGSKPIYDALLEKLLKNNKNSDFSSDDEDEKTLMEIPVAMGSKIENKYIKDIDWPSDCLLVGIKRGEWEMIPKGDTMILQGDSLIILSHKRQADNLKYDLLLMGQESI